ncbi:hypothetical protein H0H92_008618 [Tricholoma furcatifolium]|nr:hypothetical protein H0H92_008618 [Tricholoma furcatifolium]
MSSNTPTPSHATSEKPHDTSNDHISSPDVSPQAPGVLEVRDTSSAQTSTPAPPAPAASPFSFHIGGPVNFFLPPPVFGSNAEECPELRPPRAHHHIPCALQQHQCSPRPTMSAPAAPRSVPPQVLISLEREGLSIQSQITSLPSAPATLTAEFNLSFEGSSAHQTLSLK